MVTETSDTVQATATWRMNYSAPNLTSAAMFSRRVGEIEAAHLGRELGAFWEDILAHATACIFLSVAGLESYANEVFVDRHKHFPGQAEDFLRMLWSTFKEKSVLEKFDLALLLRGNSPLEKGTEPVQSVQALVRLRNALIHFKPEWENEQDAHQKLSTQLCRYFNRSVFLASDAGLFPRAWACHECTQWAVIAVLRLIEHFEERAGLPANMGDLSRRLTP
jgi:hypothetical protein